MDNGFTKIEKERIAAATVTAVMKCNTYSDIAGRVYELLKKKLKCDFLHVFVGKKIDRRFTIQKSIEIFLGEISFLIIANTKEND